VKSKVNYPSKITCPNTATIVHRERLFRSLDKARQEAKIIWLAAPGGSGKTTLLSSYIERQQVAHCWYQVDEDDGDLATFFHYLGLAGKRAAPRKKKAILKLTPEYQQGVSAFTRQFFADLSSRLKYDGMIVLDNFNILPETSAITTLLPNIADALEPGVSLLVISRHLPSPSLVSLVAKRQLIVIDSKQIQFTDDEWLAASHLFSSQQPTNKLLAFRKKLDGWIAGLILLPNRTNGFDNTNTSSLGIDILDSYIAEQFLSSLDSETSELLMSICYMPHITASSAISVSNIVHSKKLLTNLARKNLFIIRQGSIGYTLHPLVKEYLQKRAVENLSTQQLHDLRFKTSQALLGDGEYEAAADLLLELEEWPTLAAIILEHAADLFDSGRIEPLSRYINTLPITFTDCEPWINYWRGKLSIFKNVFSALDFYDQAYIGFLKAGDSRGVYLTWFAVVSDICSTLLGGNRLVTWVKRYTELSRQHPEPPTELSIEIIEAALLLAYFFSGIDPVKRAALRTRVVLSIHKATDPQQRLQLMSSYVIVAVISGVNDQDKYIIENFEHSLVNLKENDAMLYLGATLYGSLAAWSFNDFNKLLHIEQQALAVANESGASVFDSHIHSQLVIAALGLKKFDLAEKHIDHLRRNAADKDLIYQSLYMTCIISAGTVMDKYKDLDDTAKLYYDNLKNTHMPGFILHTKLLYLYYLCARKKSEEALALHDDLLAKAQRLAFPAQLSRFYLIFAKIFFDIHDVHQANKYLLKSFSIARNVEIITYLHWQPKLMTWACQHALSLDIESRYVKRFIKEHYINLPKPDTLYNNWPWAFRISTFGNFEVKAENPNCDTNLSSKSNALLKILVTAKNGRMTHSAIKEKLYADPTNNKTSQLFDTQVRRLRKYFANEQAILRHGDTLKLNFKYIWLDTIEFEILGKQKISVNNAVEIATRIQQIYKGEYFPDDDELDTATIREHYRNVYLATLFKCISYMQETPETAIEICRNALVLEPLSEGLYRRLIKCYLAQDNRDMAEITLEQCRKLIKHHLDSELTTETESLLS